MRKQQIPEDYALVLLQIGEDGEDDLEDLAELTNVEQYRLWHVVKSLQHKGLITISRTSQSSVWIRLSSKGRQLLRAIWPEAQLSHR